MSRATHFSLPLQVLLWAAASTAAGASVGAAVGVFREGGLEQPVIVMSILFGNVVGFTVLAASRLVFPRLGAWPRLVRLAGLALVLLSGAVAGTILVLLQFPLFVLGDLRHTIAVAAINGLLAVLVGSVVYVYEGLRERLADSLREVEEVRLVEARLKEQAARAELAALQARINPHFFFNTLNTISSLLDTDPERAEELLQTLAELFRYTFKATGSGPVELSEELQFIEGYLEIERARFGPRLDVSWEIDAAVRSARIPGLLLQPIVENAVGHGLAPSEAGGRVEIRATAEGGELEIRVRDDGVGPQRPPEELVHAGHGLDNVRQRLDNLFGERAAMTLVRGTNGRGLVVTVRLPLDLAARRVMG